MMFDKPLILPVFHTNHRTETLDALGLPVPLKENDVRNIWFTFIYGFSSYVEADGNEYGLVYANNSEFIVDLSPDELEEAVLRAMIG
jgi:hypothetical protein